MLGIVFNENTQFYKSLGEKAHSSRAAAAQINAKYSVF